MASYSMDLQKRVVRASDSGMTLWPDSAEVEGWLAACW